jgi:hypothetical protein
LASSAAGAEGLGNALDILVVIFVLILIFRVVDDVRFV